MVVNNTIQYYLKIEYCYLLLTEKMNEYSDSKTDR